MEMKGKTMENTIMLSRVATEVNQIIDHLEDSLKNQIPQSVKKQMEELEDKTYSFKYDENQNYENQKLMVESRQLFSAIFMKYCCSEEERRELIRKCKQNDERRNQETLEIFKKEPENKQQKTIQEEVLPVETKKTFMKRVFEKIKKFFGK